MIRFDILLIAVWVLLLIICFWIEKAIDKADENHYRDYMKLLPIVVLILTSASVKSQTLVLAKHDAFSSYYDITLRNPACVVYNLSVDDFKGVLKPSTRWFKVDAQLPPPRVSNKDFTGSGYVRGHLCPAGDRDTNKKLLKQTYLTSNLTPMTMVCNSGPWKMVEDSIRLIALSHGRLRVAAGVSFMNYNTFTRPHEKLVVPDGFWKAVRCLVHPNEVWIWYVSNSPTMTKPVRLGTKELESVLLPAVRNTNLLRRLEILD